MHSIIPSSGNSPNLEANENYGAQQTNPIQSELKNAHEKICKLNLNEPITDNLNYL